MREWSSINKIQQQYSFLLLLAIIVLSFTIILSYNITAQTLDSMLKQWNLLESVLPHFKVGFNPSAMSINSDKNIVYVANPGSDTVFAIDGVTNRVVTGVTFDVNPFHAGYIKCNNIEVPTNQYIY